MKRMLMIAMLIATLSTVMFGQIFIDPNTMVEAREFAYRLDTAPTIDGAESEWSELPWTEVRYNDRDFNSDNIIDPMVARTDYRARYKAAWVNGSNKIYFLYEIHDDYIYTSDTIKTSHNDNMSIRLDPYDEEIAGEPMDDASKNSYSIRFQIDTGENTGYEGNDDVKPEYVTAVSAEEASGRYLLEVELTLPSDVVLSEYYVMGYYPLFSDNDPEDDSPDSKNAVPMLWPQAYCPMETNTEYKTDEGVLAPDVFWRNDYYWGNIECIELNVVEVSAGASIQSAVDAASEGTIIKLAAGTYTENVTISTPKITLMGCEDGTTQLLASDISAPIITIADNDVAYGVIIENITFGDAAATEVSATGGIAIGSAQANIINNEFYYIANPIYMAVEDSTYGYAPVIEDNVISHSSEGGINVNAPHASIRYNYVEEQTGSYAINSKETLKGFCVDMGFNTIFNHKGECAIGYGGRGTFVIHHNYLCRAEELYGAGDTTGDDGIENQDAGGSQDYILNNTVVGWKSDGIQMGNGSTDFYVRNNLIAHCSSNDYDIRTVNSYDIDYGLSYGNGSDLISTLGANGVVADPQFTDEMESDFSITSSSPAVDAGEMFPYGFKFHYYGDAPDIGACEVGTPTVAIDKDDDEVVVSGYKLEQNYPNPFNPTTTINYTVPTSELVTLKVFNLVGQEVKTLVNAKVAMGSYSVNFDASNLSSGMYFYTLKAGNYVKTQKMMLLK